MKNNAPICLFVYNRLFHTKETIKYLQKNTLAKDSLLYIFSDGPKELNKEDIYKVNQVRDFLNTIGGFKDIVINKSTTNMGLANSIISGVSKVLEKHESAIVIEDDLLTSKYFLKFMNDGLNTYKNETKVASIHGYVYPTKKNLDTTFFLRGGDCWGWATWSNKWKFFNYNGKYLLEQLKKNKLCNAFDFENNANFVQMLEDQINGKNSSWAIRWYASAFLNDLYTLYPGESFVQNIGNDSSGTHSETTTSFKVQLREMPIELKKIPVMQNQKAYEAFCTFFKSQQKRSFLRTIKKKIIGNFK